MEIPNDNGYISNYLTHWTGKQDNKKGAETLSIIASECELLLSYNSLHAFDWHTEYHIKMVCFTDVPISHSMQHCMHYGKFGIVFHKLEIMNVGAQPVFYATHACKDDLDKIIRFLLEQTKKTTIESDLFGALKRHFLQIKCFSDGRADSKDSYYYEREWRLSKSTLVPSEKLDRPNARYCCQQEGYPPYIGRLTKHGDKEYYSFKEEDVAFLIVPNGWNDKIKNPNNFAIYSYEELIAGKSPRL